MKINILIKIIKEYGIPWCFYRMVYVLKIKLLNINKNIWKLFEHKVTINRIDIFDINVKKLENFFSKIDFTYKKEIIKKADEAINGRIYAFSKNVFDYGKPIQWNYNPVTQKSVQNNKMWFQIQDFDAQIGDIKIIWELSRFCHLYLFSRAYIITKDPKYYQAFSNQIQEWIDHNKYPYGVNYKCGQESALRMINILMNYSIFKEYRLIKPKDIDNIKEIVKGSYRKLLSNFFYAEKCVKNNHTFSELLGLIIRCLV